MRNDRQNIIVQKTFHFSLAIMEFTEDLRKAHKHELSSQLFRSGTSIGANIWEAQNAESKRDFVHKVKISAKEADETLYWLKLCKASKFYPNPSNYLLEEIEVIIKIISKIVSSSKLN
ncbi:four helix bundle protein [Mesonia aestuariivivens]|uniref:Four helix bundle protein n=1 Tax=Mesonia aestuariivivens TaxID=2796128 RepID=A0ABS6W3E1_9FLAO|nr:four helix bundle protein [Mesonia aestuariivivens]MBW2961648.1 four helix bundle protein [Mesonia aestuariivivens]